MPVNARREWREVVIGVLTGIVVFTSYGLLAPTRVHVVQLPLDTLAPDHFGTDEWVLIGWTFAVVLVVTYAITLVADRRLPNLRWKLRGRKDQDNAILAGIIVAPIAGLLYQRPTSGLLVLDDHTGAYVWAPADLAGSFVAYIALFGIVVALARIVQTVRRGRGRGAPAPISVDPASA